MMVRSAAKRKINGRCFSERPFSLDSGTSAFCILGLAIVLSAAASAQDRVAGTVHNLAASGPGQIRAQSEAQVCIFCHASHTRAGSRALWNRELPSTSYQIYQSSTFDARPNQPMGTSKLCLSCHDGTIALGSVLSRSERIRMTGAERVPAGLRNLGMDLSDDHPVSFVYSSSVAAADMQLRSPAALPEHIKLDSQGRMQCTACHDPHDNQYGDFLVADNKFGALCTTCHELDGWSNSAHTTSPASVAASRAEDWPHATVAANGCRSCHRSHAAGGRHRLLIFEAEEENCLSCHDGTVARTNIRAELDKSSAHDPRRYQGIHDPAEHASSLSTHVECTDCHNPHTVQSPHLGITPSRGGVGPTMMRVRGVSAGGGPVSNAQSEYEVCLRCHGDTAVPAARSVDRQAQHSNMRLKFSPSSPSFHPIVSTVRGTDAPSLAPGLSRGSLIRCTDCHNNDSGPRAGGSGPDGPHGSRYGSLLERNYTVDDLTTESQFEYQLCYKCHTRSSILNDESFPSHRLHIVRERTPCSACHDPHGISSTQSTGSDHTHLINLDTRIARPEPVSRRFGFRDRGRFAGSCTLVCHDSVHDERSYGLPDVSKGTRTRVIRP